MDNQEICYSQVNKHVYFNFFNRESTFTEILSVIHITGTIYDCIKLVRSFVTIVAVHLARV